MSSTSTSRASLARIVRGSGGPGLLLAHGATGGIDANYGPIMDGLAERYTVVGPDYPGSGRTPRAGEPLDLDGLADGLVAAAVEEGLETFAIAGYSLGGPVAIRAATRHPDKVTALALTAAFAHPGPRMRLLLDAWLTQLTAADREAAARWSVLTGAGAPYVDRLSAEQLDAAVAASVTPVLLGPIDQVRLVEGVDVRADLARVRVPTLVVSTLYDQLVTPHHHREVADGVAGAELAEIPSGHLPFAEAPRQWLAVLRTFLDRHHP